MNRAGVRRHSLRKRIGKRCFRGANGDCSDRIERGRDANCRRVWILLPTKLDIGLD